MKLFLVLGCGLMATVAAIPAAAAPFGSGANFRFSMQNQRSQPGPQRDADRRAPQREIDRRAPQREISPQREMRQQREISPQREMPPQREMRVPGEADRGRMSPDDRRQLRRDIQDAGRDIYRRDRQAPRREQRR